MLLLVCLLSLVTINAKRNVLLENARLRSQNSALLTAINAMSETEVAQRDPEGDMDIPFPLGDPNPDNTRCWMKVSAGGKDLGRVTFEIKDDIVPKTAKNFKALCTHEKPYGYRGTPFHSVIPGFMAQSGDFENGDGTGGRSIWGQRFNDENFILRHTGAGVLSMASKGENTNGSQFLITFVPTFWLDRQNVVFGQVVSGYNVMKKIEECPTDDRGKPTTEIKIAECGCYNL